MKNKISWTQIKKDSDLPEDIFLKSPIGMFRANNEDSPFNKFKFEIMDTNFRIMKSMVPLLNSTDGVDSIVFLSPYSLIISTGKLFNPDKVKQLIELRLVGRILNDGLLEKDVPPSILNKVKSKYGAVIFPNGEIEELTQDNYEDSREVYIKCAELVGGVFLDVGQV